MKIEILFEDENFLAINKPSGLVVHSDGRTPESTLVNFLEKNYPQLEKVGNPHTLDSGRYTARWGIVNRLDRETSGIILIAKNEESFLNLQKQFFERTIIKEYVALSWGICKTPKDLQKINVSISRHKKDPRIWVAGLTNEEGGRNSTRDAETDFEIFTPPGKSGVQNTTLLRLFPKTGRTHQLRLHCRFIGHPIVGDKKYGINGITNEHSTKQIDELLKNLNEEDFIFDKNSRLMLHAKSLEFISPSTRRMLKIETQLPTEFIS